MEVEKKVLTEQDIVKKQQFEELIKKQQEERAAFKENKKITQEVTKDPKELAVYIQKEFNQKYGVVQEKIRKFKQDNHDINKLFDEYNQVWDYYTTYNYVMTSYDKIHYREQLDTMEKNLFQIRDVVKPRKKFQFSNREEILKRQAEFKIQKLHKIAGVESDTIEDLSINMAGLVGLKGEKKILRGDDLKATYKLVDIQDSVISLEGEFDQVFLKNIINSTIIIGPVKSSCFVTNCQNSNISIMGHQIRIHQSNKTKFNVFSLNACIIEHCNDLIFSPYKVQFEGIESLKESSGFKCKENKWREVQDFNWLKQEVSPNYKLEE